MASKLGLHRRTIPTSSFTAKPADDIPIRRAYHEFKGLSAESGSVPEGRLDNRPTVHRRRSESRLPARIYRGDLSFAANRARRRARRAKELGRTDSRDQCTKSVSRA